MQVVNEVGDQAVVVGGSIAGLATAAVLAQRFSEVTVLERRELSTKGEPWSVAPQGGFPHVMLAAGHRALEGLLPGYEQSLYAAGAVAGDLASGRWWVGAERVRTSLGFTIPFCSRALVEATLRQRVVALPNVRVVERATVRGLRVEGGRVRGVEVDGNPTRLDGELVVDCSGRGSRAGHWLQAAGFEAPKATAVGVDLTYTTVVLRRHPGQLDGDVYAMAQNVPPHLSRLAVLLPYEGDRWGLVFAGYFGDRPEPGRDGLLAFADSLPVPWFGDLLRETEWLCEPYSYRFPSSLRRRFERLRALPAGFAALGDGVSSFNPLYGQGMSSAALQAMALGDALDRHGNSAKMPRAFARRAAKVVDNPWKIAAGADFGYPQTTGDKPAGTDVMNRYIDRVLRACSIDHTVNRKMGEVQQLLVPPEALLRPGIVIRALLASRRAPGWIPPNPVEPLEGAGHRSAR